jgi:hypothetical protein
MFLRIRSSVIHHQTRRFLDLRVAGEELFFDRWRVWHRRTDNPTATVLLGQRNPKQADSAAAAGGDVLSEEDAAWVRRVYRGI